MGVFVAFIIVSIIGVIVAKEFIYKNRNLKELTLLEQYCYRPFYINILEINFLLILITIAVMIMLPNICSLIYMLAYNLGFADVVDISYFQVLISFFVSSVIILILKGWMGYVRTRKHNKKV